MRTGDSVGIATYRNRINGNLPEGLSPEATAAASDSIDGALAAAANLPDALGEQLVSAAQAAFSGGLNMAAVVSAVVAGLAAIIVATRLHHVRPAGEAQQPAQEAHAS
ncbi:hypothetical protein ACFPZL_02165 [Leucobacter soli]|nr:hypothetical protein [Leucobacter soli]